MDAPPPLPDAIANLLDILPDAVVTVDRLGRVGYANPAVRTLLGYAREELVGQPLSVLVPPAARERHETLVSGYLADGVPTMMGSRPVLRAVHRSGRLVPVSISLCNLPLAGGELVSVAVVHDISLLHTHLDRATLQAQTDALTGLGNRLMLSRQMQADLENGRPFGLLLMDLTGFKGLNDRHGHAAGDEALRVVAQRLQHLVRDTDVAARLGGDEFVLLLGPGTGRVEAAAAAQQLLEALAEPFDIEQRPLSLSASIGVVLYPRDGSLAAAMTHAEAASREAKRHGGATFAFFEPRMLGDAREQVELLRDLRQAVAKNQLELVYQPKVHAPTGEIMGAEALLRWHHPLRGMVSPAAFIPLAERHGLIVSLGQWVIEEACRQARDWRDQGLRMRVAINLSVHQLRQPDLAGRIAAALQRHQVKPHLLTCEITESAAMEDAEGTRAIFEKLAAVGVHLSIDDFGTGYCNFAMLRRLPAEELKIDRSFVLDLETSADARAVVDAVVKLGQALGRKVVAEGVETEGQAQVLRALGCDVLQGYLYAKPMAAKALALWAMNDVGPRAIEFSASLFQDTQPVSVH